MIIPKKLVMKAVTLMLFVSVAAIGLTYLFSPAVEHQNTITGEVEEKPYTPFAFGGGNMLFKTWITYPEYNIGFGILSGIGFVGVIVSIVSISKEDLLHEEAV